MKKTSFGFTLVEVLVTLTIMGVIFGLGIANYGKFNQSRQLDKATQDLITNLRVAQSRANNGENNCTDPGLSTCSSPCVLDGYRFSLASDRYTYYAECEKGDKKGLTTVIVLTNGITVGSNSFLFKVLGLGTDTGEVSVTLQMNGDTSTKTVKISPSGNIYEDDEDT